MNPNAREYVPKGLAAPPVPAYPMPQFTFGVPAFPPVNVADLQAKVEFYKKEAQETTMYKDFSNLLKNVHEGDETRIKVLTNGNTELIQKLYSLKKEHEALVVAHSSLENKKDTFYKTAKTLGNEVGLLQDENEQLKAELRQLQSINDTLNQNLYSANAQATMMEKSLVAAKQLSASLQARLFDTERVTDERCRVLQEELTVAKAELESHSLECKMKVEKMQNGVTTALQLFMTRCMEAEEQKNEAQNLLVTLYNRAAAQAQEAVTLRQTLESLLQVRHEENVHASSILSSYENRIFELQAYKGITSTLYVPPPAKVIMNPETDYDDDDPTHDIWAMTIGNA
jgi:DNA repair exonuclease SbcCD ATPase subunit